MSNAIDHGKATLYIRSMISIIKVEVNKVRSEVGPYAQYKSAVTLRYLPKGKRKERSMVETSHPSLVVLDGWGHPEPAGMWDESTTVDGMTRGRYASCDPKMGSDFAEMLSSYLNKSGARVLLDLRNHNADPR